ncbi:MAG: putative beta-lysine N-acetyltransferase [Desulfococcaceae bacterium]
MADRLAWMGNSRVQHGKVNRRIYLMKLDPSDLPGILDDLDDLAQAGEYGKIFVKIPESSEPAFLQAGYRREAFVPGFFSGLEAACFMARYPNPKRRRETAPEAVASVLALARDAAGEAKDFTNLPKENSGESSGRPSNPKFSGGSGEKDSSESPEWCDWDETFRSASGPSTLSPVRFRILRPADTTKMAALYRAVFPSYPFPILDPDYLRSCMENHVLYVGAEWDGTLAAISAAEMDPSDRNVEMTDFATLPEFRRHGLARRLLARMEKEVRNFGIRTAYTIARAGSPGMNLAFAQSGYAFAGTLVNNTHIAGRIESMNVWYKRLDDSAGAQGLP